MQWVISHFTELAICLNHERNIRCLDADLDLIKTHFIEIGNLTQSRFNHRLRGYFASVLVVQFWVKRSTVDTNTNGDAAIAGLRCHSLDVLRATNIPWVKSQTMDASLHRRQGHLVLMMNVSNDWHRRTWDDLRETFCSLNLIACATDDVTTRSSQSVNLLQSAFNISGLSDRH